MVTKKTIRCVGRRLLLAFLASAGTAGVTALPAAAQTGSHMPPVAGPAVSFGLNDVPLAPGEKIVSSSGSMGSMLQHGGGSYQIIDPSAVPTASNPGTEMTVSEMPMMSPTAMPSHSMGSYSGSCATGNCGNSGFYSGGMGKQGLGMGGNACGPTCNPYLYASLEGLYMMNTNVDNYTRSRNFVLDDFDFEFGVRATLGIVPDCRNGMEVSFTGPFEWETAGTRGSAAGNLDALLVPRSGLPVLTTFNDATAQSQRYEAEYFSLELNRTLIGWEICKLLYGLRYVDYDEDYLFATRINNNVPTPIADIGGLSSNTQNQMIGAQVGAEMTFPLSCKVWSDFRGRAGAYANFAENDFTLVNAGTTLVRNFDDAVELAGIFEIGGGLRYYFNDDFHIRAGTELWYMTGVATAIDQFSARLRPSTGRNVNIDDDVLVVGVSLGAELKF